MYDCRILMTPCQIANYNRLNVANCACGVADLARVPLRVNAADILAKQSPLPQADDERFDGYGHYIGEDFYQRLKELMNEDAMSQWVEARFGVAADQAMVRLFPTNSPSYRQRWVPELDRFAQSLLKVGELVLIWHESSDKQWFFIQNRHIWGWVPAAAVGLCSESVWRGWLFERDFVQVIANRTMLEYDQENQHFLQQLLMGSRLPFRGYCNHMMAVLLPKRNEAGKLAPTMVLVPDDARFQRGLLPFQEGRVAEQAMKLLGEPYGWGGERTYRDCTSMIDDIFSVFNFNLARNSTQQRQMVGVKTIPKEMNLTEREILVRSLPKGTVLYLPGHAMLYLGVREGNMRIIHSVFQIGVPMWSDMVTYKVKRVMLGHLLQYRTNGETFLESLSEYWCPWVNEK